MKKITTTIIEHLLSVQSVAMLTHVNPDWDCLGSSLALQSVLRRHGVRCDIVTDEPLSSHLSCFGDSVRVYDGGSLDYGCLCCVDAGDSGRIGLRAKAFSTHPDTVCIDHHLGDGSFAQLSYIDPDAAAVGEIIFDMLKSADIEILPDTAKYLYCAISTDTGSFKYANTSPHTMEVVGELMNIGINTAQICEMLYERKTLRQLMLQGEAISTLELHCGGKIATAYISGEVYKKYNADKTDTEALAPLPRMIDGVVMSAFLSQRTPDEIRINLRAKGDYNVREAAVTLGGGGHVRASGCTVPGSDIKAAVKTVVKELEKQLWTTADL